MKEIKTFPILCAVIALFVASCTGDSLQPTASKNAYTPTTGPKERPISDFLSAQGTYCVDPEGKGDCFLYVPPAGNYAAWHAPDPGLTMYIDYAGVANRWVGEQHPGASFSTYSGRVVEEPLSDGRARITVQLTMKNAMVYMVKGTDLANSEAVFGYRTDKLEGSTEPPAMGNGTMTLTLINPAPGMPIPDLVQLAKFPQEGQKLLKLTFRFDASGTFRDQMGGERQANISVYSSGPIMAGYPGQESMTPPMAYSSLSVY